MHIFKEHTCPCRANWTKYKSVLRKLLGLGKPTRRLTRSGRCVDCGTAPHREGQVLLQLPEDVKQLVSKDNPEGNMRGYDDENLVCRLSILPVIVKYTDGLEYEEEVGLAERVYTQLKMEGSPLVDPRWEDKICQLPDMVFQHFYGVVRNQVGG
ncbi:uncharacterized protein F4812DRAFT_457020 [Daldinia caldariorum]|uniref:uncharacterized protein n=1 Tax=Daldinia caldariorum TaxID=326644 RepID=UPI0020089118|nr:uncharacterized protein F4812DRAFT_457020 [Daldinia caldariorum]KAI1469620.1 hypothetical protein F4812DRAFT_457020 [Daldinia caldariorum]